MSVAKMGHSRVGIQLNLALGNQTRLRERESCASARESSIASAFCAAALACGRESFDGTIRSDGERSIRFRQAKIGQCILRIPIDSLLIKGHRRPDLWRNQSGIMITACKIKLIGLDIIGVPVG